MYLTLCHAPSLSSSSSSSSSQPSQHQIKESRIKKQFHDTVKIQQRQYKTLQKQLSATLPKERHKDVLRQTREEQMRKMSMLAMQYERTIAEMLQQQQVHFLTHSLAHSLTHSLTHSLPLS